MSINVEEILDDLYASEITFASAKRKDTQPGLHARRLREVILINHLAEQRRDG